MNNRICWVAIAMLYRIHSLTYSTLLPWMYMIIFFSIHKILKRLSLRICKQIPDSKNFAAWKVRPDFYLIIKHNRKQDYFSLQSYKWTYYYLHYLIIQWPNEVKITKDMFEVHLRLRFVQCKCFSIFKLVFLTLLLDILPSFFHLLLLRTQHI